MEAAHPRAARSKFDASAEAAYNIPAHFAQKGENVMHRHIGNLAVFLIIATVCFVACAVGMLTPYHNIAIICGMVLVFVMTCGFFYATLHLSKVH